VIKLVTVEAVMELAEMDGKSFTFNATSLLKLLPHPS
jgi:hypothetical protein